MRPAAVAAVCSGVVTAQFIAGKATRDALYLANYDVTTLPLMVVATAVASIVLAVGSSKGLGRIAPGVFVPLAFAASAVLLLMEWALVSAAPKAAAIAVYLQISGVGPMLGSGFWLIVSERFDPRTAKGQFGYITAAGTLGGLAGGLLSERAAAGLDMTTMLPILAALNLACAWLVRRLAVPDRPIGAPLPVDVAPELSPASPGSGFRLLRDTPYLRSLAALVVLGSAGAALIDYAFKAAAVSRFGSGELLLRFFAVYYAGTSLLTFLVQAAASGPALRRFGLATNAATPSVALLAGGVGALVAPALATTAAARGAESIFRGSLFRSSYEIFYTPIPPREKRAAKSLIDVGLDRLGDATGAMFVRLALLLPAASQVTAIVFLGVAAAGAALVVASRLQRGYIETLERSLVNRALELDLGDVEDTTTRTAMLRTIASMQVPVPRGLAASPPTDETRRPAQPSQIAHDGLDPDLVHIRALRSRDRETVSRALRSADRLPASAIPDAARLLAWDLVAADASEALRRVAEEHIGQLVDVLVDVNQEFAVRRRLARVLAVCVTQRAADGLILGLDDHRFEVRFQCARSLKSIAERNPRVHIDRDLIFEVVRRETAVGRPVWDSHRLLKTLDDGDEHVFVDDFVKDRASRSLAHVFTLLSLALPPEPVRIAFRGLHTDDPALQGTALEYLEGVLPSTVRQQLWPYLEDRRPPSSRPTRPRDEILADLVRSHDSILINLEEFRRREGRADS